MRFIAAVECAEAPIGSAHATRVCNGKQGHNRAAMRSRLLWAHDQHCCTAPRNPHSPSPVYTGYCRTLSVETRSAVSSSVNWLIWSTMVAILGLVGAAAASDCHLRCILCCAPPTAGRAPIAGRAAQTQRLRARDAGADMLCGECGRSMGWMDVVVVVDFCGQRDGGVAQAHAPQKSLVLRSSRGQARHRNFNVTTYPPPLYESVEIMGRRPESYIQHSYRSIAR